MKKIIVVFLFCPIALLIHGKSIPASLPDAEIRLQILFSRISQSNTDEQNLQTADSVLSVFEEALHLPGSFEYGFDSLKFAGKITSADKKIRIFTWNIALENGTGKFYGFILSRAGNNYSVFKLKDGGSEITNLETATLEPDNWPGCLVYEIVETRIAGETCYTILGYRPENMFITRKLIDILWFNNGRPVFGKTVFHYNKKMQGRIVFEYSAKAKMSLTWNKGMAMIVFDHLSPVSPSMTGNYQYYAPDLSFDALVFEKGIWELKENIDPRNEKK
jgi:hypothetical protein